jgi:predicted DNA-binding WGR domain protein
LVEIIEEKEAYSAPSIDDLIAELNAVEEKPLATSESKDEEQRNKPETKEGVLVFERLEFSEGASNKYWQVVVDGNNVHVQYGRIGNNPQTSLKTFETEQKALAEKEKMMAKKVAKGYVKV